MEVYQHSKTGNMYHVLDMVFPLFKDGDEYPTTFEYEAHCSENKDVLVPVYRTGNILWFGIETNSSLFDNKRAKVLYERGGEYWLRSLPEFHELVDIGGKLTPRFVKVVNSFQTSS